MALTAMSPSTLPHEAVWDEAIVPALRKRLENESYTLSKRMSAASMTSNEDLVQSSFSSNASYLPKDKPTLPSYQAQKPSAIPRPSLQQSRPMETSTSSNGRSSRSGSFQRSRTLSQPFMLDRPATNGAIHALDQPSRSASPMVVAKSTRIPVSRARTGSVSSNKQPSLNSSASIIRSESRNGTSRANGLPYQSYADATPDLWPVNEHQQPSSVTSRATLRTPRSQVSELVNEQPPFNQNSVSSRGGYDTSDEPRMSTESEERPFEHWYRGDVSRNGGVGELRVARRQEMLDIANYGHSLRQASSRTAMDRSRSNSRGRDLKGTHLTHRSRAESLGARESIYIDDDDRIRNGSMVFDERPPTDLESDGDDYDGLDMDYYTEAGYEREENFEDEEVYSPPAKHLDRSDTPSTLVEPSKSANTNFKSRIPTPTPRQFSESSRAETPTQSPAMSAEQSTPKSKAPSQQLNVPVAQAPTNKRRAKSPASAASSTKKSRNKSPAKPQPRKRDEVRASVAQYPTPEGDDLANAIPTWTQPAPPPSGNWDDAVLPVVARKKGLEGQYVHVDGSPKPPKPRETIPEPAPGTFGFKYRSSRNSTPVKNISMDEFGQRSQPIPVEKEESRPSDSETLATTMPPQPPTPWTSYGEPGRDSPAPFAHYSPTPVPQIEITRPSNDAAKVSVQAKEEDGAGCCKCVIM
ncbi:hypothetical protein BC835DRAFT_1299506 [Cytidiella melzeri]|nr:hypothetical protein BC835DRAFT_1299506 [Cytidiella melzeri]